MTQDTAQEERGRPKGGRRGLSLLATTATTATTAGAAELIHPILTALPITYLLIPESYTYIHMRKNTHIHIIIEVDGLAGHGRHIHAYTYPYYGAHVGIIALEHSS